MQNDFAELAKRCQLASGPNRPLDYRIAYALGWRFNGFEWDEQSRDQPWLSNTQFAKVDEMAGGWKDPEQKEWPYPGDNYQEPPHFTGSVDVAMTLLPKWSWRVGNLPSGRAFADLGTQQSLQGIEAATPALALCAAALRARAP